MSEEVEYYTVPEAARELRVSQATVWRWIKARRLRAYRVGPRRIRIRKQDLGAVVRPVERSEVDVVEKGQESRALFVGYEPKRVKEALRRSAGALRGIDRERLLSDLRAERDQDSSGRPH